MQARFKSGKKPVTLSFRQYQEREKHVVNKDILYQGNDFNDALDVVEENSVDRIPIVISEDLISSEVRFEEIFDAKQITTVYIVTRINRFEGRK